MTPFGQRVRDLRKQRGMSLKTFAGHLGVSSAYVSALEHGRRGRPTFAYVQGTIQTLGVIWDEADALIRLADISDPRVTVDTEGLEPSATLVANRMAREIALLDDAALGEIMAVLDRAQARRAAGPPG